MTRPAFLHVSFLLILWSLLVPATTYASHYRAGEITYEQITERKYKITAFTYTDPTQEANVNTVSVTLFFGDGTSQVVARTRKATLSAKVQLNVYEVIHEYISEGQSFLISLSDPYRVDGIKNINRTLTGQIMFYVETLLRINSSIGYNRSPILLKPPIDEGCINQPYVHNPGAFDPDGDSLVFSMIPPLEANNQNVPNYVDPLSTDSISINSRTGQLTWWKPVVEGYYNIAILITEYRKGIRVGYVIRDMQIYIGRCGNTPPVVQDMNDRCVVAGESMTQVIEATDVNTWQNLTLSAFGGPFIVPPVAVLDPGPSGTGVVNGLFKWTPACNHIRYRPYQALFQASDNDGNAPMVGLNYLYVRVIGPKVLNMQTQQVGNGFRLTWNRDTCKLAAEYRVYKRIDSSHWNPSTCETGVPAYTGFKLIAKISTINNPNDNTYYDDDNGKGLSPLVDYCYRVVAVYPPRGATGEILYSEESESIASDEVCGNIILSKPIISRASVDSTSTTQGRVSIHWLRPRVLDTLQYKSPYLVTLQRTVSGSSTYTDITSKTFNSFLEITNDSFTDTLLNTTANQYVYRISFKSMEPGNNQDIGTSPTATTIRTGIYCTDRTNILSWNVTVPWVNDSFIVYRKNSLGVFERIGQTTHTSYSDQNLTNGINYCYVIQSIGQYRSNDTTVNTMNFSQEICGTPIDTVRPCPPELIVISPCNSQNENQNILQWTPRPACAADVVSYRIYFKQLVSETNYILLADLPSSTLTYTDNRPELKISITGCYYVAGVDSVGNESHPWNETCVENCPKYEIPNVFTPNGDGKNDLLNPFPYRFVDRISMNIYNRWGQMVFHTNEIDINWDGKDQDSKKDCLEGVYFFICDVYETYLDGIQKRTLRGTIELIRN